MGSMHKQVESEGVALGSCLEHGVVVGEPAGLWFRGGSGWLQQLWARCIKQDKVHALNKLNTSQIEEESWT